ncbi:MAG: tRNA uridine-5-carboxymethylaminomethyl(34) synthesis enzyme MnmG [bacterium]
MYIYPKNYDCVIVGAGHAGCEAALACARMGMETLLLTTNIDSIALMPCNPAIGGLAKGHLVKEIDALGGEMAKVTDKTGIQFKILNKSRGPAVQSPRAQSDKLEYRLEMTKILENQEGLDIKQGLVEEILVHRSVHGSVHGNKVKGVRTDMDIMYRSKALIICTGTFLNGLVHVGLTSFPAGRMIEFPSNGLAKSLNKLGFRLGRLKTGTNPRLDSRSIDFSKTTSQYGDIPPTPFSYWTKSISREQLPCFLTYTNKKTHKIILNNLKRSPLYSGRIKGIGPRYCPSIEDKVVRFPDKERHQIFLEPEGRETTEIYANGISTSLPSDIQLRFLRTIEGLENAEIIRPGYAIEYDFVYPDQIKLNLETKLIEGLFLAGQINGTSGYEEAAAQGLMAGINAVLKIKKENPFILNRSEAYIGVLIDDLVTKEIFEPYRMFTSRAEYRLILRIDNTDQRLMGYGNKLGLISNANYKNFNKKMEKIEKLKGILCKIDKKQYNIPKKPENVTLTQYLKRPEARLMDIVGAIHELPLHKFDSDVINQVEIQIKYEGYINRQALQVKKFKNLESKLIPDNFDYSKITSFSCEAKELLLKIKPRSIGQASRITGVTPADVDVLMIYLKKIQKCST